METINLGIEGRIFDIILKTNRSAPFYQLLGVNTLKLGPGYAELAVETKPQHANPLGLTHGGLISTLADAAMGNAIRTTGKRAVTADYTVSFLAPAPVGDELLAKGNVVKAGNSLIYTRADLFWGDKLIAISQGTFYVVGNVDDE